MKHKTIKRVLLILGRFSFRKNQKYLVFAIFLLLSTLFWFLNELNQNTETRISIPVRYSGIPSGKVLANELPQRLDINLEGPGYTLLRYVISPGHDPFTFDLKDLPFRMISDQEIPTFYLLTSYARDMFEKQLPAEVQVTGILPDTIYFVFDEEVSRKVVVEPVLDLQFEKQFMQHGAVIVQPDSVTVSGAKYNIDTIRSIKTRPLVQKQVNGTIERSLPLVVPPGLSLNTRRAEVIIHVEQFTETVLQLDIETLNVPDSVELKIFPNKAQVTGIVALSDYHRIQPEFFRIVVDFGEYMTRQEERMPIRLARYPEYLKNIRVNPLFVEYLIEEK